MNKNDLINMVASESEISRSTAHEVLDSMVKTITNSLKMNDAVRLTGFGTFSLSKRSARKGRNPKTGESLNIAAKKVVRFKVGSDLKEAVRK